MEPNNNSEWQDIGDWKDSRVRSGAKALIWVSLVFGVAFIGISLPGVLAVPEEIGRGNYAILMVLLFPLVGLGALTVFVYGLAGWFKFGKTELVLDPVPGSIGGDFGGSVDTRITWHPALKMDITLSCQRLKTTGSGKNRSTRTTVLWQREGIATLSPIPNGTRCEFRFDIPDDLPQSEKASSDYHQWQLLLECELPGVDFKRAFTVPVFNTGVPQRSSLNISYARESAPLDESSIRDIRISNSDSGLEFYYPWYRHIRMGALTAIFGAVFVFAGYFAGTQGASMIFPVAFGGVGGLCIIIGLYLLGNTLTTTVSEKGIRIVRSIYGIRFQRKATRDQISGLQRRIGSQMQTGTRTRVYYAIDALTRDGRKLTIADTLEGSRLADYVENRISNALWPEKKRTPADLKLSFD